MSPTEQLYIGIIASILAMIIAWFFRDFLWGLTKPFQNWVKNGIRNWLAISSDELIPRKTVTLVTSSLKRDVRWSAAKNGNTPVTCIRIQLTATNIANRPIKLIKAILKKPVHSEGRIIVEQSPEDAIEHSGSWGDDYLLRNAATKI